ncbi:MAG: nuclear transport factor 2 family protein [Saprospiraceae bacterium]|nr:nuclear transport factor 2 family protein [Saprospiraceae bacterium]
MKHLTMLVLALFGAFLPNVTAQDATAKNKATVIAAYDALNRKDWAGFAAQCAPNYTEVNVGPAPAVGINAALGLYQQFQAAFPDFMVKINEIAPVSPTRFLLRVTVTGTNTGSMMGLPPTGKPMRFDDADVVELDAAGKIISHAITNSGEPLRQIGYGTMLNPNTGVVLAAYGAFGNGNIAGVLDQCADDIVWDVSGHQMPGISKTVHLGKAGVGQFFTELSGAAQFSRFEPRRFLTDGDDVVVLVYAEMNSKIDGHSYAINATHHFNFKNGKIARFTESASLKKL